MLSGVLRRRAPRALLAIGISSFGDARFAGSAAQVAKIGLRWL